MLSYPKVDLVFRISGKLLVVDHGYALYSAVSRVCPRIHAEPDIGLKLIRGRYIGNGRLDISPFSELVLRLPAEQVRDYLSLAGKSLRVREDCLLVGVPHARALQPRPTLFAALVTTRNGQDQDRFTAELTRQLAVLGCQGKLNVGRRRTCQIHGKQVVGHEVMVTGLSAPEAITLQEAGLGGRRKMGCGFFEPYQE